MAVFAHIDPEPERNDQAYEDSPLLPGGGSARDETPSITPSVAPDHPKFLRVVVITILCLFLIELGDYMLRAPFMRVLEDAICRTYFKSVAPTEVDLSLPIPEAKCKIPPVQSELANLTGWDSTFSCIPSILLAVPYGILADKYGRKPILILSLFGLFFSLIFTMFVGELAILKCSWVFLTIC
jgi:MFS family permease